MGKEQTRIIRIRTHLESETLSFPELKQFIGKNVEIIVEECVPAPKKDRSAFFEAAKDVPIDLDAVKELREASKPGAAKPDP
jgi:hypothetical protein